jgi:nitrate/nitrite transporter NarK
MSIANAGILGAIPFFFGCVGAVTGGWLCDFLTRRGWTPMGGRKLLVSSALFGVAAFTLGAAYTPSNAVAIACISACLFLIYIASSASWATVPVAAPSQFTASLGAIQNCGGYIGGAFAPMLTGFIVQRTGSFQQALVLSAGITVAAAITYLSLVRRTIR